jgi:hypothetical protein
MIDLTYFISSFFLGFMLYSVIKHMIVRDKSLPFTRDTAKGGKS